MTTENPEEGNQNVEELADANPPVSQTDGQPLSGDVASQMSELIKRLDAVDGQVRAMQKGKDKAVDRMERTVGDLTEKLVKYLGVDEAQLNEARRAMVLDDLYNERYSQQQPEAAIPGKVEPKAESVDVHGIATALELDPNDPKVMAAAVGISDSATLVAKLSKLKGSPQPQPSEANQPTKVMKPAGSPTADALLRDYEKDMLAARGQSWSVLSAIREEYKEKGLDVDHVVLPV